ncbi:MAG: Abasic site processing protein [Pseudomonadota bacterium]|nr:Abasic site processing protein [Pseudomonadota bacterium]
MCGRFAFYSPHEAVARLFGVAGAPEIEPRYNIAPTQFVATVRETGGPREVAMLYWGLVPLWAKEKSIGARMINARSETLAEKPSFRNAYKRRRCLLLADGYYEWQRSGAIKQPYLISFAGGEPFGMAGLWERWRDPGSGEPLESCCIVTTSPAPAVAHVHDRMPVIIPPDAYAEWLDPDNAATDRLERLLAPCEAPGLQARPVSRRVNDARNQGADLLEWLGTADDAP